MGLLASLLWLVAAIALADRSPRPWVRALAVVSAGVAGTTLPDLDLLLPIGHRSGLTHSLLPLALALFARTWRPVMAGLAIGIGLHLAADTFPNAMRGYATVKLPSLGSLGAAGSYAWLGVQALVATLAGAVLLAAALPFRFALPTAAALAVYAAFGWLAVRRGGSG